MRISFILIFLLIFTSVTFSQERIVLVETTEGNMKIKLYDDTPRHRDYFLNLVQKGYFDGTLFGRVVQQFIIQGGSQDSRGVKPGTQVGDGDKTMEIPHEIRKNHIPKKGAVGCPRRDEKFNPAKDSDMSMYFIILGRPYTNGQLDTLELAKNIPIKKEVRKKLYNPIKSMLDSLKIANPKEFNRQVADLNRRIDSVTRATPGSLTFTKEEREAYTTVGGALHLANEYTFFGEVIEGLDVIDKISDIPTNSYDRPIKDVVMNVKILK